MADPRGRTAVCDDRCGCPSPCPGGLGCRCSRSSGGVSGGRGGDEESIEHKRCSCGEHCGCNPCTCSKSEIMTGSAGRASCKCGAGCSCLTCAS